MAVITLRADPSQARQLTLAGPMLLWRDAGGGGRREGLVLTTDLCTNPECTDRHVGVQALRVGEDLVSVEIDGRELATSHLAGSGAEASRAFFVSVDPDDGRLEPQGEVPDADALAWFRAELDRELLGVLLVRFEAARRHLREAVARSARPSSALAPGRNDPCPCGSGRKFKKCCQAAA